MNKVFSMTGFASIGATLPGKEGGGGRSFGLTMKAVNHRHLDLSIRLPMGLDALEPALRRVVKERVRRGHVELTMHLEKTSLTAVVELDEVLLGAYVGAFARAAESLGLKQEPDLNALLRIPGVMQANVRAWNASEMEPAVLAAMGGLLEKLQDARSAEGEALAADLEEGMKLLAVLSSEAAELRKGVAAAEYERLRARLEELLSGSGVSEERLLTEAALMTGRSDVEEELVRLRTHTNRFRELLKEGGEVGRQLDFLLQEMNREANTLLSKSGGNAGGAGLRLTEIGLETKVVLERAREQVQNLE